MRREVALSEAGDISPASRDSNLRREAQSEDRHQTPRSLSHPQLWGLQMIYKSVKLPALKVRTMLLHTPRGRIQAKKWSSVPFPVPDFDYVQHCAQALSDLSLD